MLEVLRYAMLRDLLAIRRRPAKTLLLLAFFMVTVALYPLAVGPDEGRLRVIGAGVIWVSVLLCATLGLDRIFFADEESGYLEQIVLAGSQVGIVVFGKCLAHWLHSMAPLILLAPIAGLQLGLPPADIGTMVVALLLGTPSISFLASIVAALTIGIGHRGTLPAILTIPLCAPVLIFGTAAVKARNIGTDAYGCYAMLLAILLFSAVCSAQLAGKILVNNRESYY